MKAEQAKIQNTDVLVCEDSLQHIHAELTRVDKLIEISIYKFRHHIRAAEKYVSSVPTYVTDDEVAWLITGDADDYSYHDEEIVQLYQQLESIELEIDELVTNSLEQGITLPLANIAKLFNLSWLEYQAILLCLAPELRRRYDRIFSYLQDDITRKKPSLDLLLSIFCNTEQERWQARHLLNSESSLVKFELIDLINDVHNPSGSSGLAVFMGINQRILNYILGVNIISDEIKQFTDIVSVNELTHNPFIHEECLKYISQEIDGHQYNRSANMPLLIHLSGRPGVGKQTIALQAIKHYAHALFVVDMEILSENVIDYGLVIRRVLRESILLQAPVYFKNMGNLQNKERNNLKLRMLTNYLKEYNWIYFSDGSGSLKTMGDENDIKIFTLEVNLPSIEQRVIIWNSCLKRHDVRLNDDSIINQLSEKFVLTPAQINIIVYSLDAGVDINPGTLIKKCQSQSNQNLVYLAKKISPGYCWEDIILPEETKGILKTVCNQVDCKYQVFNEWGFLEKIRYGRGLSVLFCGSSGTGKTMAAQVIANELKLDLYKIDLSNVVSKYIGETEKNLEKVFTEAETSNAILFFDECDALFGKRTEISDAHDRYANLEVSFLLQKIEEYDGIVILATNLRGNMDDAFIRRIRFIIDFPFPDMESRKQIWCKSFPNKAPCSDDIDYELLARKIKLSGGNIKNIVLNAAFNASDDNDAIRMRHILLSTKAEYQKIGKSWNENIIQ